MWRLKPTHGVLKLCLNTNNAVCSAQTPQLRQHFTPCLTHPPREPLLVLCRHNQRLWCCFSSNGQQTSSSSSLRRLLSADDGRNRRRLSTVGALPLLRRLVSPAALVDGSPQWMQPYLRIMRADKPIGTWLLYWPCTWSIALATDGGALPDAGLLLLFGAGAWLMRGAGCVVNDLWDRDFDRRVERTKNRPLASGDLNERQALLLLGGLLSASFGILMQLNWYSVFVGATSLGLVVSYPLAKRYTYWPQFVLGLTLNWGVLISWTHLNNGNISGALPLYLGCVVYTMIYDTIYSHQDKTDDLMVGIKSTALHFGDNTKPWLTGFGVTMIGCLTAAGVAAEQTWPFYAGVSLTAAQLAWQISSVNIADPNDCWNKFRSNQWLGAILFASIICGNMLKKKREDDPIGDCNEETGVCV